MRYRRSLAWITLLLVMILVMAGCAPRIGAGETAKSAAADALVVDLPAIALDVAEDGSLSLGGLSLTQLGSSMGLPADIALPADTVKMLTAAGVQHVQVDNTPTGLALLVNGQQIPSLAWSRDNLATVAGFAAGQPALAKLVPILTQLGVGVTLRLPVAEGVAAAPLQDTAAAEAAAGLAEGQEKFLSAAGSQPTIILPLVYKEDGTFTLGGTSLTGDDLAALSGQALFKKLEHSAAQMAFVKEAGIQNLTAEINQDGVAVTVNGIALPNLDWSGGKLAAVISLAKGSGLLNIPGMDPAMLQGLLDAYLPMLTASDIQIVATYPAK